MSTPEDHMANAGGNRGSPGVDLKFEGVMSSLSDADRAKGLHSGLGCRLDADFSLDDGFPVVTFTPAGSGCSVQFGTKITSADPGTAQRLTLIVSDIGAAHAEWAAAGAEIGSPVHPGSPATPLRPVAAGGRIDGSAPEHGAHSCFATFADPDGNMWLLRK